jgi:hypothetical protein
MQNLAEELSLDPELRDLTEARPAKPGTPGIARHNAGSKELSTFSLNLSHTEVMAHAGSIACLRLLYHHFNQAIEEYKKQRQLIELEELDSSIERMVRSGRHAAEGSIKRAAPVLISNLCLQVAFSLALAIDLSVSLSLVLICNLCLGVSF